METSIIGIISTFAAISILIFGTILLIAKAVLSNHGFKVSFMFFYISDYDNLKKLSSENSRFKILYGSLIVATISVSVLVALFILTMIFF
jgi:uncharacterized membrane-anchored protein